jgi:hypothetical protein
VQPVFINNQDRAEHSAALRFDKLNETRQDFGQWSTLRDFFEDAVLSGKEGVCSVLLMLSFHHAYSSCSTVLFAAISWEMQIIRVAFLWQQSVKIRR